MKRAWLRCLEEPSRHPTEQTSEAESVEDAPFDPRDLATIGPDTPIGALPLPASARNALDRAGLVRAADLLAMRDNRLSAIRGIGTRVSRRIFDFRDAWIRGRQVAHPAVEAFFPGYRGEDQPLDQAGLEATALPPLADAGLRSLAVLASAPTEQVDALATRHRFSATALRDRLVAEHQQAEERAHPTTLEGWVDALLSPRSPKMRHPRRLFGLEKPFEGRSDVTVKELAGHGKITTAAVYIALGKARESWQSHPHVGALEELCATVVADAGGAIPLERAARELASHLSSSPSVEPEQRKIHGAALLRLVAELQKEAGIRCARLRDKTPWMLASEEHLQVVRVLGDAADKLAHREPLASPSEAARVLQSTAEGTPLGGLPMERLAAIAVAASRRAALSTRLEIYPRDIEAKRALELCAAVLKSGLTEDEVRRRVLARYPQAKPLPARPLLDELLQAHRLEWNAEAQRYDRPGEGQGTSLGTSYTSLTRLRTGLPAVPPLTDQAAIVVDDFDRKLAVALERRSFRVLGVTADRAQEAAVALGARLRVKPVSFDQVFLEALENQMRLNRVEPSLVHEADRLGSVGSTWTNLLRLARMAVTDVELKLLPPREPLLLVQPGLLARYRLEDFLRALVDASKRDEAAAIFLLVPSHDVPGVPRINGELVVPGVLAAHALRVPREWLAARRGRDG
jgi:hypothetical protein